MSDGLSAGNGGPRPLQMLALLAPEKGVSISEGGVLYLDVLFVVCVAALYLEPFLCRTAGKSIANVVVAVSIWGLLSLLAAWCVEAF